jgi:pyruvoyl-dependent arginine decarboxylase (PvlArgDC)
MIAASVAIGHPTDASRASVIMEHACTGCREEAERVARAMAFQAIIDRRLALRSIESISVERKVAEVTTVFAGVVQI